MKRYEDMTSKDIEEILSNSMTVLNARLSKERNSSKDPMSVRTRNHYIRDLGRTLRDEKTSFRFGYSISPLILRVVHDGELIDIGNVVLKTKQIKNLPAIINGERQYRDYTSYDGVSSEVILYHEATTVQEVIEREIKRKNDIEKAEKRIDEKAAQIRKMLGDEGFSRMEIRVIGRKLRL